MTRVLVFNEPDVFQIMDVHEDPAAIITAVNSGNWMKYLPAERGPLYASQQDELVIITHYANPSPIVRPKVSRREMQVLQMLAEGLTASQIALQIGVKPRTVRGYVARLKVRLGAQTGQQLLARAVALGLLKLDIQQ